MTCAITREVASLSPEERRRAPRAWVDNGSGVRLKVIDPVWLKDRVQAAAVRALINGSRCRQMAEIADADWAEHAEAYRLAVKDMQIPCCHRAMQPGHAAILMIAGAAGLKVADVKSGDRSRKVVSCRQEIMWVLATQYDFSLPKIGGMLGGRDHTTVLHGIRRHQSRIDSGEVAA